MEGGRGRSERDKKAGRERDAEGKRQGEGVRSEGWGEWWECDNENTGTKPQFSVIQGNLTISSGR